jgi:hypothetical protein
MKVIIAGSRDFNDYEYLKARLDTLLQKVKGIEVISGTAAGADTLGERWAWEKGYKVYRYIPDWPRYGKRAGFLRNEAMARDGDALVAFWDGKSKGTKMMIDIATKKGLKVKVYSYADSKKEQPRATPMVCKGLLEWQAHRAKARIEHETSRDAAGEGTTGEGCSIESDPQGPVQ